MPTIEESLKLGLEHQQAGRLEAAEALYQHVLACQEDNADALHLLGVLDSQTGRNEQAVARIARAIALQPAAPLYHNSLGNVLQELGRVNDSLLCYEEALRLDPHYADARINRGNALNKAGRFAEALESYLQAQQLKPDSPQAYTNLGHALRDHGLVADALGCFDEALRLEPGDAESHCVRATIKLQLGDFEGGWEEYEWRWRAPGYPRPAAGGPTWDGSPLEGRTILLQAEQGLGDTIQFARYSPLVKARGGTVIVACQPRLAPLIETVSGVDRVIAAGAPPPPHDVQAPLMSLPRIFGTTLETIPYEVPYVSVDEDLTARWAQRIGREGRLRIGIAWAGNPANRKDSSRSLAPADFTPLARVRGITLFSLQRGQQATDAEIESLERDTNAITDTAAMIRNLDLVISADTMIAHLAGALARPVWTLLSFAPDWRWFFKVAGSPWYPTMRLFRQKEPGNWSEVMERVVQELA